MEADRQAIPGSSGAVSGELAEKYWAMAKEPETRQAGHHARPSSSRHQDTR